MARGDDDSDAGTSTASRRGKRAKRQQKSTRPAKRTRTPVSETSKFVRYPRVCWDESFYDGTPVKETQDLVLPGEPEDAEPDAGNRAESDSGSASASAAEFHDAEEEMAEAKEPEGEKDVPMRQLHNWGLVDEANDNVFRPLEHLNHEDKDPYSSKKSPYRRKEEPRNQCLMGLASPEEVENPDEDANSSAMGEEEDGQQLVYCHLSAVLHWVVCLEDTGPQIWVLTSYSWYRLIRPHPQYAPFFERLAKTVRLAWRIWMVMFYGPDTTLDEFFDGCLSTPFMVPNADYESDVYGVRFTPMEEHLYPLTLTRQDFYELRDEIDDELTLKLNEVFGENIKPDKNITESQLYKAVFGGLGHRSLSTASDDEAEYVPGEHDEEDDDLQRRRAGPKPRLPKFSRVPVTPFIAAMDRGIFGGCSKSLLPNLTEPTAPLPLYQLPASPPECDVDIDDVEWVGPPIKREPDRTLYSSAKLKLADGTEKVLERGTFVLIRGQGGPWIARILYFHGTRSKGSEVAHVRYFNLGRETFLRELGRPRELFLLYFCADVTLDSICGFPEVTYFDRPPHQPLDPSEHGMEAALRPPPRHWMDEPWSETSEGETYRFGYSSIFDEDEFAYVDAKAGEDAWDEHASSSCVTCARKAKQDDAKSTYLIRNYQGHVVGVQVGDLQVFLHDTVYMDPGVSGVPFNLAYIEAFVVDKKRVDTVEDDGEGDLVVDKVPSDVKLHFREFVRKDEQRLERLRLRDLDEDWIAAAEDPDDHEPLDERELYLREGSFKAKASEIRGLCRIRLYKPGENPDAFKDASDDNFYYRKELRRDGSTKLATTLPASRRREQMEAEEEQLQREFKEQFSPLKAVEMFCGAGGFALGVKNSGLATTIAAVDQDVSGAHTFKKNFEGAKVFREDVSAVLESLVQSLLEGSSGNETDILREAEALFGGSPCQGFTSMNMFRTPDDVKNAYVAVFLSFLHVASLDPKFKGPFILENVPSMASFRAGGVMDGKKMTGGIKGGILLFVVRVALDLGMNVRFGVLEAGRHGAPQQRRRLIVMATRRGTRLPDWPAPSTVFQATSGTVTETLKFQREAEPKELRFNAYGPSKHPCASHPALTVLSAISDLPGFEYDDPCQIAPVTEDYADLRERRQELYSGRLYSISEMKKAGFAGKMNQPFEKPPLTNFQRLARQGCPRRKDKDGNEVKMVTAHVAPKFLKPELVEALCRVALFDRADHFSLPPELLFPLVDKGSSYKMKGIYVRNGFMGCFGTLTTTVAPGQKQGTILHPSQRRLMSVREFARAQGFPDRFQFTCTEDAEGRPRIADMYKQIGNAVPVPLAKALGLSIKKSIFESWKQRRVQDAGMEVDET